MAHDKLCLYDGQIHYIVMDASVRGIISDGKEEIMVFSAINKVECTSPRGVSLATFVNLEDTIPLLSSFDFQYSEWYMGVYGEN